MSPGPIGALAPTAPESALDQPGPVSLDRQAERLGRAEDLHLESLERDIELRTMFGKVLLGIAIIVNLATITLVTLTGLGLAQLSDKLLITLISSTVAELAGLVLVVAKYLFPATRRVLPPSAGSSVLRSPLAAPQGSTSSGRKTVRPR